MEKTGGIMLRNFLMKPKEEEKSFSRFPSLSSSLASSPTSSSPPSLPMSCYSSSSSASNENQRALSHQVQAKAEDNPRPVFLEGDVKVREPQDRHLHLDSTDENYRRDLLSTSPIRQNMPSELNQPAPLPPSTSESKLRSYLQSPRSTQPATKHPHHVYSHVKFPFSSNSQQRSSPHATSGMVNSIARPVETAGPAEPNLYQNLVSNPLEINRAEVPSGRGMASVGGHFQQPHRLMPNGNGAFLSPPPSPEEEVVRLLSGKVGQPSDNRRSDQPTCLKKPRPSMDAESDHNHSQEDEESERHRQWRLLLTHQREEQGSPEKISILRKILSKQPKQEKRDEAEDQPIDLSVRPDPSSRLQGEAEQEQLRTHHQGQSQYHHQQRQIQEHQQWGVKRRYQQFNSDGEHSFSSSLSVMSQRIENDTRQSSSPSILRQYLYEKSRSGNASPALSSHSASSWSPNGNSGGGNNSSPASPTAASTSSASSFVVSPPAPAKVKLAKKNMQPVLSRVADWLGKIIDFVRVMPELADLKDKDKKTLLINAWPQLLMLCMSENDFDFAVTRSDPPAEYVSGGQNELTSSSATSDNSARASPINSSGPQMTMAEKQALSKTLIRQRRETPTMTTVENIQSFIAKCQSLDIEAEEYKYLKKIVLFFKDIDGLNGSVFQSKFQKELQDHLATVNSNEDSTAPVKRYSRLLICLPAMYTIEPAMLEALFCKQSILDMGGVTALINRSI